MFSVTRLNYALGVETDRAVGIGKNACRKILAVNEN